MKTIDGKKFLEDSDKVVVSRVIVGHHYGLNALLTGTTCNTDTMTFGEFKKRRGNGTYPDDDGVCVFRYDVTTCNDSGGTI